jgi:hypothetical protein
MLIIIGSTLGHSSSPKQNIASVAQTCIVVVPQSAAGWLGERSASLLALYEPGLSEIIGIIWRKCRNIINNQERFPNEYRGKY